MSIYRAHRAFGAAQGRGQREAMRAQRDSARQQKEQAKLGELGLARLEVAESESAFEVLLSLHKDCAPQVDWIAHAAALRPAEPGIAAVLARRAWRSMRVSNPTEPETDAPPLLNDSPDHPERIAFLDALLAWEKNKRLAERVLAGDEPAFIEGLEVFSSLDEVTQLGANIDVTFHSVRRVEIDVRCNDTSVVPSAAKSLTASGKVSEKPVTRARFHEIYQDHVCSALLRVAREAFSVLPISELLISGHATVHDSSKGTDSIEPIYSVLISRSGLEALNFDRLDPSDAIEGFPHRGNFKASRKAGAFQPIERLRFDCDAPTNSRQEHMGSLASLRLQAATQRDVLVNLISQGDLKASTS